MTTANKISINEIKKLREITGSGIMECRKALEEAKGDNGKAQALLKEWGIAKAEKKADRTTGSGIIYAYIHHGNRVGMMIELSCETDFVASTEDFKNLAHELALQITSMHPKTIDELLPQEYIRDTTLTVGDLIKSVIGKLGENIAVKRFVRYEMGLS